MTLPKTIGVIQKNATEQMQIILQEYKGNKLCDIRVHGKFSAAQTYMPTSKGVAFAVDKLPELIAVLIEAEKEARRLGLIPQNED